MGNRAHQASLFLFELLDAVINFVQLGSCTKSHYTKKLHEVLSEKVPAQTSVSVSPNTYLIRSFSRTLSGASAGQRVNQSFFVMRVPESFSRDFLRQVSSERSLQRVSPESFCRGFSAEIHLTSFVRCATLDIGPTRDRRGHEQHLTRTPHRLATSPGSAGLRAVPRAPGRLAPVTVPPRCGGCGPTPTVHEHVFTATVRCPREPQSGGRPNRPLARGRDVVPPTRRAQVL